MGYGEFLGGGSVKWGITHSNGDHGSGGPHGGDGRDKDPANNSGAVFTIWAFKKNGVATYLGAYPTDDYKIKVEWAPRTGLTAKVGTPQKLVKKSKRAKAAARKSYKSA